jgi:hypothetical protein
MAEENMTDIVERLRERKATWMDAIEVMEAAADEIERLRAVDVNSKEAALWSETMSLKSRNEWLEDEIERLKTALRRIVSLDEKNVPKYAQQIARETNP